MTLEEINILSNAILDTVETYVDETVKKIPYSKSKIGVISGKGTLYGNKVYVDNAEYDNISSIGNVIYSNNVVVQICVPNNQMNNMYIIGGLTERNITIDEVLSTTSENPVQNKVVTEKLNELFTYVSNGKQLIASAITDKGVPTDANDTFQTMHDNIEQIETGTVPFGYESLFKVRISEWQFLQV